MQMSCELCNFFFNKKKKKTRLHSPTERTLVRKLVKLHGQLRSEHCMASSCSLRTKNCLAREALLAIGTSILWLKKLKGVQRLRGWGSFTHSQRQGWIICHAEGLWHWCNEPELHCFDISADLSNCEFHNPSFLWTSFFLSFVKAWWIRRIWTLIVSLRSK